MLVKIPVFLYYYEDGGRKLLLNVGTHVAVWMVLYPRRWTIHYIAGLVMWEQINKKLCQKW